MLTSAGYQTRLVGKSHSIPKGNHFGFEHFDLHDGLTGGDDDYSRWLDRRSDGEYDEISHGVGRNSWDARPSHLEEHEHPTNWTANRAIDFLTDRDSTRPFFLYLSFVRPHQPFDPPQAYWDMYIDRELPDPYVGDWAEDVVGDKLPDYPQPNAWVADLPEQVIHRARTGYYGSITHIDHQLNRVVRALGEEMSNTFIVFTSDHGDMLGDHYHWRKTYGYEGSARVPFVLNCTRDMDYEPGRIIDRPVGLEDVMPTLLEVAGIDIPESVDGRSVLRLLENENRDDWREYYHGEHGPVYDDTNAVQYIVDERTKYLWNPVTGEELLFDLESDPGEERDLTTDPDSEVDVSDWRAKMISHLEGRPEGFSDGESLQTVDPEAILGRFS
jgi:arylsulfatase A-like enzyme